MSFNSERLVLWVLSAWWQKPGVRLLVALLVVTGAVDLGYSWIFMENIGASGELNPAIRHFYQQGLIVVWLPINIIASLIGGIVLGSLSTSLDTKAKKMVANAFGILLAVRFATTSIALTNYYLVSWLGWGVLFAGFAIFLTVRRYLISGYTVRLETVAVALADLFKSIQDSGNLVATFLRRRLIGGGPEVPNHKPRFQTRRNLTVDEKRRLITGALTIIAIFVLLAGLLTSLQSVVFQTTPWWLRELGIVTQIQGQAFLVGFVAILVSIAVVVYTLSSIMEILLRRPRGD